MSDLFKPLTIEEVFNLINEDKIKVEPVKLKKAVLTAIFTYTWDKGWPTIPVLDCIEKIIEGETKFMLSEDNMAFSEGVQKAARVAKVMTEIRDSLRDFLTKLPEDEEI